MREIRPIFHDVPIGSAQVSLGQLNAHPMVRWRFTPRDCNLAIWY